MSRTPLSLSILKTADRSNVLKGVFQEVFHNWPPPPSSFFFGTEKLYLWAFFAILGYFEPLNKKIICPETPSCSPNSTDLYFWYLFVNIQIQKTWQGNLLGCILIEVNEDNDLYILSPSCTESPTQPTTFKSVGEPDFQTPNSVQLSELSERM